MAESLRLVAWTPGETLLDVEPVAWVHVALSNGKSVTIYPGHAPMLVETVDEQVRYEHDGTVHRIDLPAGVLSVRDNVVTLFLAQPLGAMAASEEAVVAVHGFERLGQTLLSGLPSRRN